MKESELSAVGIAILIYISWLLFIFINGLVEYLAWFPRQDRYQLQNKCKHNCYEKSGYIVNDSNVRKHICFTKRSENDPDTRFNDREDVHRSVHLDGENVYECVHFNGEEVHRSIHCEGDAVHRSVHCKGMGISITISTVDENLQSLCHNKNQARAHRIWRQRRGKIGEKRKTQSMNENIGLKTDDPVKEETVLNAAFLNEEAKTSLDKTTCIFYNVSCHDEHGRELTLQIKSNKSQIMTLKASRNRRQKLRDKVENRYRTNEQEKRTEMSKDNA